MISNVLLTRNALRRALPQASKKRSMMISSKTSIYSAPFLAVQTNFVALNGNTSNATSSSTTTTTTTTIAATATATSSPSLSFQQHAPPASGWKKTIVSSAASVVTPSVETTDATTNLNGRSNSSVNGFHPSSQSSSSLSSSQSTSTPSSSSSVASQQRGDDALRQQHQQQQQLNGIVEHKSQPSRHGQNLELEVDMEELQHLASLRCTPLSLRDMYKYAVGTDQKQRIRNARFLHRELPIRIAQRAVDLLTLPHGFGEALPIQQVAHVYLLKLEKFQECPVPTTPETEAQFTDMLQDMVLDRTSIPVAVAQGVDAWLKNRPANNEDSTAENHNPLLHPLDDESGEQPNEDDTIQEIEDALYRFFTARVGLRFLTEHHILSSPNRDELKSESFQLRKHKNVDGSSSSSSSSISSSSQRQEREEEEEKGCIQTDCCPKDEVEKVVKAVTKQTEEQFGFCPEVQIISSKRNKDVTFTYVPHHLHYMVGELLKNSCRATAKKYLEAQANGEYMELPPIRIVIVKGKEDVTIKVADRGGGIPRSKMPTVFRFAHSTAGEEENSTDFGVDEMTGTKIRGFGLPLARIYARYLGGEMTLKSMEGYGLDAYLYLPRLGDACENLPLPVKFSPGELNSNPPRKAVL